MSNDAVEKETEQVHEWLRQHGVSDDLHEFSGDPVSKLQVWDLQVEVPVDFIWIGLRGSIDLAVANCCIDITVGIRGWPNGSGGQIGTISGNLLPGITLAVGYDVASMQGTIRTYLAEGPNPKWLELDVDLHVFNRAVKEKGVQVIRVPYVRTSFVDFLNMVSNTFDTQRLHRD
ncbi:hypothetical protein JR316_0006581 [Psilocybe cubensis]|uniref:Uncharacterized protein n=1 Tax=Psilocybe cubensis TaxID=181762 RepID=A0ACB8GWZ1_PSICU|nr:hypothetical protein JR316_0006581 [Psilocybe cubensis]KAH9479984.1 hypothetical protein JR316_0006581 [Psilocybe cubensis]